MAEMTLPEYYRSRLALDSRLGVLTVAGTVVDIDDDQETFDFRLAIENRGESEQIVIIDQPFALDYIITNSAQPEDQDILGIGDVVEIQIDRESALAN